MRLDAPGHVPTRAPPKYGPDTTYNAYYRINDSNQGRI
jgi:hypothetical protein